MNIPAASLHSFDPIHLL